MSKYLCPVCNKKVSKTEVVTEEKMYGTKEKFIYNECENCKSLTINEIPPNLSEFYKNNYYSFTNLNPILRWILYHNHLIYFKNDFIGKITKLFISPLGIWKIISELYKNKIINFNSEIIDIGCGNGDFLYDLYNIGFRNLVGIDPYLENKSKRKEFTLYNNYSDIFSVEKKYDMIFLKDSLEHVDSPYELMNNLKKILKKDGLIIISIPIKSENYWRWYNINWYQLDAPRHLTLFSLEGFKAFVKNLNLNIEKIQFDTNEFSFLISEDYVNDIPLSSKNSFSSNFSSINVFKRIYYRYMKKFNISIDKNKKYTFKNLTKIVQDLNKNNKGEHAIFILKKNK